VKATAGELPDHFASTITLTLPTRTVSFNPGKGVVKMRTRLLAIGLLTFVLGCAAGDPCSQLVGIWAQHPGDEWGIYMDGQYTDKVVIEACEGYALRPYHCEGNTITSTDGGSSCPSTFAFDNDRLTLMSGEGCDEPVGTVIVAGLIRVDSDCRNPLTCSDPGNCRAGADVLDPPPEGFVLLNE
jgi:hypothetical protein